MKRFGSIKNNKTESSFDDIFLLRLNLMVVMIKASLNGYPVGRHRKKAAMNNITRLHKMIPDLERSHIGSGVPINLFKERVKLMCVMATAIICNDFPLGVHRRAAVLDNLDILSQHISPYKDLEAFHAILKVA